MKILSWNCNQNFSKKYEHIESINADISIIQECERLKEDHFPEAKFFWTGKNESKGLGILVRNQRAFLDPIHNTNLINFLPINVDGLRVLGVWAYNHRAVKFGKNLSGNTIDAINFYEDWLTEKSQPCIFGGDFNNAPQWDKKDNLNNFQNINSRLNHLGFESAYHTSTKEVFGSETSHTFFHTKNESNKYHIDYLYLRSLKLKSMRVGTYDDWIKLSDHTPLILDIEFKKVNRK